MAKRSRKNHKGQTKLQELVVVAMAETSEEAKEFETLLKNNDIPAMVKRQRDELSDAQRFVVMVPEEHTDEAHVIIESQDAFDDFYDSELDEGNEDDFSVDFYDDEF